MLEQKTPNLWNYTRLLVILLLIAICCSVFWAMIYYFSRFQQPNFPSMWKIDIAVAQISCACTPTLLYAQEFLVPIYYVSTLSLTILHLPLWISKCCQTWDRFFSTIQHRSFFHSYYREQKNSQFAKQFGL